MDQATLAELTRWVDQYAAHSEALKKQLETALRALYVGQNLYSTATVTQIGAQAANSSDAQAIVMAGLASQYVATTTGIVTGDPLSAPSLLLPALRNGADMTKVFQRPAKLYRRLKAQGVDQEEALARALDLVSALVDTNMTLAQRAAYTAAMEKLEGTAGITGYRRVVHPELAKTGSCGLCVVASDQKYKTSQLMPLHPGCNCTVLPIIGDLDPGASLNEVSLSDLYAAAGSTHAHDLINTKVVVHEHGEYGPVLWVKGQKFTSLDDLQQAA